MFKIIPSKKSKGLCVAYGCKNKHTPKNRFCAKHNHRYQKFKDPVRYCFNRKKNNARTTRIEWKLTLEEFREFCEEHNYLERTGKLATSASIDRIDPGKGYEKGNLQILSLADNNRKMHEDNKKDECPF